MQCKGMKEEAIQHIILQSDILSICSKGGGGVVLLMQCKGIKEEAIENIIVVSDSLSNSCKGGGDLIQSICYKVIGDLVL